MVKMSDVAKKAGVSVMTVSRVINGINGKVSEKTRKKVLEIIKELNYHPNYVGRALHGSKLKIIGIISPLVTGRIVLENPFYYELMMGIEEVCTAMGFDVMISTRKKPKNRHGPILSSTLSPKIQSSHRLSIKWSQLPWRNRLVRKGK